MENKEIVLFNFGDQLVRVVTDENGNPWWVAKDVCKILELGNVSKAISGLDDDEKADITISDTSSNGVKQTRNMLTISESGLYALVFRSRKPEARAFSKWVRSEVLPAIRKTGRYEAAVATADQKIGRYLKPVLRERVLNDALQMARLSGIGDPDMVERIYERYCELVSDPAPASGAITETESLSRLFITDCLTSSPGAWLAAKSVYGAFRAWWLERSSLPIPSQKFFGSLMRLYYGAQKRGGYYSYRDCAFA